MMPSIPVTVTVVVIVALWFFFACYYFFVRSKRFDRMEQARGRFAAPMDDGRLRIRNVSLDGIRAGRNWRLADPNELMRVGEDMRVEDLHIEAVDAFDPDDCVVYSALSVAESGAVTPMVLIKPVDFIDFGGEWCEYRDGAWQQAGLTLDPTAHATEEFVANPLDDDPSFAALEGYPDSLRAHHRAEFARWRAALPGD